MPKPSSNPDNCLDPLQAVCNDIAGYLASRCGGEIDRAYCKPNSTGLYVSVAGSRDCRFHLADLDTIADTEKAAGSEGHGMNSVMTVGELLALNLPAPPALIEGLLHEGETIVVAGRQKVGKSRLTQQMALSIVTGKPFLGMAVSRIGRVLMIDLENRPAPLSERFRRMGVSPEAGKRLHVWCAGSLDSAFPDATADGKRLLSKMIEQVRPDVLIIDPWRLWLDGDENDAQNIVRGLKALAALRVAMPTLAIIIVHHVRKEKFESPHRLLQDPSLWADAVSGHHALSSYVDACYGLERQAESEKDPIIVFGGIARNTTPQTVILEEEEQSLLFAVAAMTKLRCKS
jgi:hypothetical protein